MQNINCAGKSDEELVLLTLKNQDFFLCLMSKYSVPLTKYILRSTNATREDAEDILQDAFIKIYRNLNDFDPGMKFSSWAYRITHNEIISRWRRNKTRPELINSEAKDLLLAKIGSNTDIEKDLLTKDLRDELFGLLTKLDEKYRQVIILRYFEEKDYKEISDILKLPINTVGTLLSRAKKKLERLLLNKNIKL